MAVQPPRAAASSSIGVTPLPGSSRPEARSTDPCAVDASNSSPSFFQASFTGSLRAICPSSPRPPSTAASWFTIVYGAPNAPRANQTGGGSGARPARPPRAVG